MRIILFLFITIVCAFSVDAKEATVLKKENVAGMFYADDAEVLRSEITKYLDDVDKVDIDTQLLGLVAPHAGYIYSGPIAAYSYKQLEGKEYDAVVVMAPSHYFSLSQIAGFKGEGFETPLGNLEIDNDLLDRLISEGNVVEDNRVFEREHALEVQLPFLKYVYPKAKIVPLILGQVALEQIQDLAASLARIKKEKNILVIASTDLSHYHAYEDAKVLDDRTIKNILSLDLNGFINDLQTKSCEACGYAPLLVLMHYFNLLNAKTEKLYYANSGDTAGDKDKVVGYVAIAGYALNETDEDDNTLEDKDKKFLLKIARETLENKLSGKKLNEYNTDKAIFDEIRGAFVTLHKNGQLRGCIGNYGNESLKDTIVNMAISAATKDPRFSAVNYDELKDIDIEISVLSPIQTVQSADEIILGKHGVIVSRGFRQGVFLPQVADETGWTKEEFLSYLCEHKAGLPADAWKDNKTSLKVFSAEVFSENEFK